LSWESFDSYSSLAARAAEIFLSAIRSDPRLVLGLPTGRTPIGMYERVVAECSRSDRTVPVEESRVPRFLAKSRTWTLQPEFGRILPPGASGRGKEPEMPAALNVRIDDQTADRLRARAEQEGLSVEDEAGKLLQEALQPGWAGFWAKADGIRHQLAGRTFEDSAELIREDRDR